jgi:cell division protein FtsB
MKGWGKKICLGVSVIAIAFTLYTIGRNVRHAIRIHRQISQLEIQKEFYRTSIERDSLLIERLKQREELERYAREQYKMQRKGETVYIVE